MKKTLTLLALVLFTSLAFAQAPNKMSYQSVIRDSKGTLVTDKKISVQISVLKGTKDGEAVYQETHTTNTNANGLVSLEIGGGIINKGKLADIDWENGPYFIKTATDATGGTHFDIVGVSELLSVPYALNARNGFSGNYNDLHNTPTKLSQFVNDLDTFSGIKPVSTLAGRPSAGIPSQVWSLFGNSNTDATEDKLGTTDYEDLVVVTNNLDRFRIKANGDIQIRNSLEVGLDLTVKNSVFLNTVGGQTTNNGNFTVANASATNLTGTLTVDGATDLNNTLNVDGAADLNNTLTVDGATNLNSSLDVNNASPTHLSGVLNVDGATDLNSTLNVDGVTNLNSAFNVNNGATSHLTGNLDVDGTLNVDGATSLQSSLSVNNLAATHLTGTLLVDRTATFSNPVNANGQVTISANVGGGEGAYGAYPLRVEGSAQGVAIKLTAGTPNNSNNFITFFNSGGGAVGRIEGETTSEATSDPEFIFDNAILVAEEAKAIANQISAAIPVVVAGVGASAGPCGACIAMAAADLILATANLAAYNVFALENLGVTYQSGSADYAEWLERSNPGERITAGDIVSVTGGKISKNTIGAQQFMVISTKPAILGNMPMNGNEKAYEKVAFMGQIPVKVRGIVVAGDYILPSGLNDGTGIAVAPTEIKAAQYRQIVGVAWSSALIEGGVSLINMAIGLNSNDVAALAIQQEIKINALEAKYNSLEQRLLAMETGKAVAPAAESTPTAPAAAKVLSRNEQLAATMPSELSNAVMEEAMTNLENTYKAQGIDIKNHPGLNKLFNDAAYRAQVIRKAQEKYRLTYQSVAAKN